MVSTRQSTRVDAHVEYRDSAVHSFRDSASARPSSLRCLDGRGRPSSSRYDRLVSDKGGITVLMPENALWAVKY